MLFAENGLSDERGLDAQVAAVYGWDKTRSRMMRWPTVCTERALESSQGMTGCVKLYDQVRWPR